jgi:hypothetical protein
MFSYFRVRQTRLAPGTGRPIGRLFRPRLEDLEDRCLPSTITVTNLSDTGSGSLRDAIAQAAPGDAINFAGGLQGMITLATGELAIAKNLDIEGPGGAQITVSGNNSSRVFDITAGVNVTIAGLAISNGQVKASSTSSDVIVFGGGIYNAGTLTLSNCTVSGNTVEADVTNSNGYLMLAYSYGGGLFNNGTALVTGCTFTSNLSSYSFSSTGSSSLVLGVGHGGAIGNSGQLRLTDSTVDGNKSGGDAGGLYNSGQAVVKGSTFSNNSAANGGGATNTPVNTDVYGGGIDNDLGTLAMANCTVANNQAMSGLNLTGASGRTISAGGGVYSLGELSMINCTIAGNAITALAQGSSFALSQGGGVCIDPSSPHGGQLVNTIVAGNSSDALGQDVFGPFASLGHNLIGKIDDSSGWLGTDLTGTKASPLDPLLGPLQGNGGPTQTIALLPGSTAIDAGDNNYSPGPDDQRGDGFPRIVNGTIDIGAFEAQGGGASPVPTPRRGGLPAAQLAQAQAVVGSLDAIPAASHSWANELTWQQPTSKDLAPGAQRETLASTALDFPIGIAWRNAVETLFAADHNK